MSIYDEFALHLSAFDLLIAFLILHNPTWKSFCVIQWLRLLGFHGFLGTHQYLYSGFLNPLIFKTLSSGHAISNIHKFIAFFDHQPIFLYTFYLLRLNDLCRHLTNHQSTTLSSSCCMPPKRDFQYFKNM